MRTKLLPLAMLSLLILAAPAAGQSPETFAKSKRLLAGIHEDIEHLKTVYCGCPYTRKGPMGGDIDRDACGLRARKNETRSDRVEWEHVVPASWIGRERSCWTAGHALCVKKKVKAFKGRKCCEKAGVAWSGPASPATVRPRPPHCKRRTAAAGALFRLRGEPHEPPRQARSRLPRARSRKASGHALARRRGPSLPIAGGSRRLPS